MRVNRVRCHSITDSKMLGEPRLVGGDCETLRVATCKPVMAFERMDGKLAIHMARKPESSAIIKRPGALTSQKSIGREVAAKGE